MAQWVKAIAAQTWQLEFHPKIPCDGGREPVPQSGPLTWHKLCAGAQSAIGTGEQGPCPLQLTCPSYRLFFMNCVMHMVAAGFRLIGMGVPWSGPSEVLPVSSLGVEGMAVT